MCLMARVEAGLWLEPSIMYIYYIISFSLFPFFTCYKNVLVNIHVQISVRCIFSSHANSVFNILTNKQEALLLHILSKNWWSFQCLHILPNTCYGLFHSLYHFIAYTHTCVCVCVVTKWVIYWVWLTLSWWLRVLNMLSCAHWTFGIFFEDIPNLTFCPFSN